jgi:hypothetical protein
MTYLAEPVLPVDHHFRPAEAGACAGPAGWVVASARGPGPRRGTPVEPVIGLSGATSLPADGATLFWLGKAPALLGRGERPRAHDGQPR